eukprot:gene1258-1838_t
MQYHESEDYTATVTFATETEWRTEIEELLAVLSTATDVSSVSSSNCPPLAKLEAVIGGNSVRGLLQQRGKAVTVEELLSLKSPATELLGKTVLLRSLDAKAISTDLARYVDSGSREREAQMWPLVRTVCIRHNWALLSTGAVIVDLPGVQDANSARGVAALKYRDQCHTIWVAADITRAVDDATAHDLTAQQMKKFQEQGNQFGEIGFVCTKADTLDADEILRGFRENMGEACTAAGLTEAQVAEVASKLNDLDLQLSLKGNSEQMADENDECTNHEECATLQGRRARLVKQQRGYCARLRNAWIQGQLRASLGAAAAAGDIMHGALSVFTVSSQEMQKLEGRLASEGPCEVFSREKDTGIPSIRAHIATLTERHICHQARPSLERLAGLLNSVGSLMQLGNADALRVGGSAADVLNRALTELFSQAANAPVECVRQLGAQHASSSAARDLQTTDLRSALGGALVGTSAQERSPWEVTLRRDLASIEATHFEGAVTGALQNAIRDGVEAFTLSSPVEADVSMQQADDMDPVSGNESGPAIPDGLDTAVASVPSAPGNQIILELSAACRDILCRAVAAADVCMTTTLDPRRADRMAALASVWLIRARYVDICSKVGVHVQMPPSHQDTDDHLVGDHQDKMAACIVRCAEPHAEQLKARVSAALHLVTEARHGEGNIGSGARQVLEEASEALSQFPGLLQAFSQAYFSGFDAHDTEAAVAAEHTLRSLWKDIMGARGQCESPTTQKHKLPEDGDSGCSDSKRRRIGEGGLDKQADRSHARLTMTKVQAAVECHKKGTKVARVMITPDKQGKFRMTIRFTDRATLWIHTQSNHLHEQAPVPAPEPMHFTCDCAAAVGGTCPCEHLLILPTALRVIEAALLPATALRQGASISIGAIQCFTCFTPHPMIRDTSTANQDFASDGSDPTVERDADPECIKDHETARRWNVACEVRIGIINLQVKESTIPEDLFSGFLRSAGCSGQPSTQLNALRDILVLPVAGYRSSGTLSPMNALTSGNLMHAWKYLCAFAHQRVARRVRSDELDARDQISAQLTREIRSARRSTGEISAQLNARDQISAQLNARDQISAQLNARDQRAAQRAPNLTPVPGEWVQPTLPDTEWATLIQELDPLDCAFLAGPAASSAGHMAAELAQRQLGSCAAPSAAQPSGIPGLLKTLRSRMYCRHLIHTMQPGNVRCTIKEGVLRGDQEGKAVAISLDDRCTVSCSVDGTSVHFFSPQVFQLLDDCASLDKVVMDCDLMADRLASLTPSEVARLLLHLCISLNEWERFRPLLQAATERINFRGGGDASPTPRGPARLVTGDWHLDLVGTPSSVAPPRISEEENTNFGQLHNQQPTVKESAQRYAVGTPMVWLQGCMVARVFERQAPQSPTNIVTIDQSGGGFQAVLRECGPTRSRYHACAVNGDLLLCSLAELPGDAARAALVSAAGALHLERPIEALLDLHCRPSQASHNSSTPSAPPAFNPWVHRDETEDAQGPDIKEVKFTLLGMARYAADCRESAHRYTHGYPASALTTLTLLRRLRAAQKLLAPGATLAGSQQAARRLGATTTVKLLQALLEVRRWVTREPRARWHLCHWSANQQLGESSGQACLPFDVYPATHAERELRLTNLQLVAQCTAPLLYGRILALGAADEDEPVKAAMLKHGTVDGLLHAVHNEGENSEMDVVEALDRLSLMVFDVALELLRAYNQKCVETPAQMPWNVSWDSIKLLVSAVLGCCAQICDSTLRLTPLKVLERLSSVLFDISLAPVGLAGSPGFLERYNRCTNLQIDMHAVWRERLQPVLTGPDATPEPATKLLMSPGMLTLPLPCLVATADDLCTAQRPAHAAKLLGAAILTQIPGAPAMGSAKDIQDAARALLAPCTAAPLNLQMLNQAVQTITEAIARLVPAAGMPALGAPSDDACDSSRRCILHGLATHVLSVLPIQLGAPTDDAASCCAQIELRNSVKAFATRVSTALCTVVKPATLYAESLRCVQLAACVKPLVREYGLHGLHADSSLGAINMALSLPVLYTASHTMDWWRDGFQAAFEATLALPYPHQQAAAVYRAASCVAAYVQTVALQGHLNATALTNLLPPLAAMPIVQKSPYLSGQIAQLQATLVGVVSAWASGSDMRASAARANWRCMHDQLFRLLSPAHWTTVRTLVSQTNSAGMQFELSNALVEVNTKDAFIHLPQIVKRHMKQQFDDCLSQPRVTPAERASFGLTLQHDEMQLVGMLTGTWTYTKLQMQMNNPSSV